MITPQIKATVANRYYVKIIGEGTWGPYELPVAMTMAEELCRDFGRKAMACIYDSEEPYIEAADRDAREIYRLYISSITGLPIIYDLQAKQRLPQFCQQVKRAKKQIEGD